MNQENLFPNLEVQPAIRFPTAEVWHITWLFPHKFSSTDRSLPLKREMKSPEACSSCSSMVWRQGKGFRQPHHPNIPEPHQAGTLVLEKQGSPGRTPVKYFHGYQAVNTYPKCDRH